ncbi:MAG: IPT/TIG domain-containing protein, partial [Candidatus Magasanikbacteria bacterium]|nr:IPT/TIG domain-containing protein [Candidatus Magasanikbacteria bacterium]
MELHRNKILHWIATGCAAVFLGVAILYAAPIVVHAQIATSGDLGLTTIQQTSGIGATSFGTIIARIIRIVLSLTGLVTICIIIFGGFKWMTAGGSEKNYEEAKRFLANGVIGLVIVLSAFGITEFVFRSLSNATGTQLAILDNNPNGGGDNGCVGTGCISTCTGSNCSSYGNLQVKRILPHLHSNFANTQVTVVFTALVDETTVPNNIKVTDGAGAVAGTLEVLGDSAVFTPSAACPTPNETRKCFTPNTEYTVTVTGGSAGIKSATTKKSLNCVGTSCVAKFTVGDKVDTQPPSISNYDPIDNAKIPLAQVVPISAWLADDNGIAYGRVLIDGKVLETLVPGDQTNVLQEFLMQTKKFNTLNDKSGQAHTISLYAHDVADNYAIYSYKVGDVPLSCLDGVKDVNELDIDCSVPGGTCGSCGNTKCTATIDCANGLVCDATSNTCVKTPLIQSIQPQDGAPGTYVTIAGTGFGNGIGEVKFMGDPNSTTDDVVAELACNASWADGQVIVKVPVNAKTGAIQLTNNVGKSDASNDRDGLFLKEFLVDDVERPGLCSISPAGGKPGKTQIVVTGNDFLSNASYERKLFLSGYELTDAVWGGNGDNTVTAYTPVLDPGEVQMQVTIKSLASNPLSYTVLDTGGTATDAAITSVTPGDGGIGQYITITGMHFGSTPNKVYVTAIDDKGVLSTETTEASFAFPKQCASTFWTDTQIIAKIPDLPHGAFAITVLPAGTKRQSNYKVFTISDVRPGPQVCAMQPNVGPGDGHTKTTLYGENFGNSKGSAIFLGSTDLNTATDPVWADMTDPLIFWNDSTATIVVPKTAKTGNVYLINRPATPQGGIILTDADKVMLENLKQTLSAQAFQDKLFSLFISNPMKYTVADCRVQSNICGTGTMCCTDGSCQASCTPPPHYGVFAWCFSTGQSCDVIQPPYVVEECGTSGQKIIPSPSPSSMWTGGTQGPACLNAMVSVKFTQAVDPITVTTNQGSQSSLRVEECADQSDVICAVTTGAPLLLTNVTVQNKVDENYAGLYAIPKNLKPSTRYKVSLSKTIVSADTGIALRAPQAPKTGNTCVPSSSDAYCYVFQTSTVSAACLLTSINVSPSFFGAPNIGSIKDPLSTTGALELWLPLPSPADRCQILDPDSYNWQWGPQKILSADAVQFAYSEPMSPKTTRTGFLAKTPTSVTGTSLYVEETTTHLRGTGFLSINPGPPTVIEQCELNGPRSPTP